MSLGRVLEDLYSPGSNWDLDPLAGLSTYCETGILAGLENIQKSGK